MHHMMKTLICLAMFTTVSKTNGAKILMFTVFGTKSTMNSFQILAENLAKRGHELTYVTREKLVKYATSNISYVLIPDRVEFSELNTTLFEDNIWSKFPLLMEGYMKFAVKQCASVYKENDADAILALKGKADLLVFDFYLQECFLPYVYALDIPTVLLHGNMPDFLTAQTLQIPIPIPYVHTFYYQMPKESSLLSRVWNTFTHLLVRETFSQYFYPAVRNLALQKIKNLPHAETILQNSSVIMGAFDTTWNNARPMTPVTVDIAGFHCHSPKQLPPDLENAIAEAGDNGFILFAMGTFFEARFFPPGYVETFLSVFSKLKQTVIWKSPPLKNQPPNVKTFAWLPQQDLLGHPKARMFITHGGMYSVHEAVYHGVPMLGIGIFGDQIGNLKAAADKGIAIYLDKTTITADSLLDAINSMLTEPKYKSNSQRMSSLQQDQPQTAIERAMYAIEYVLRHKGAPHLKGSNLNLNFIEYFCLDVIACIIIGTIIFFAMLILAVKAMARIIYHTIKF